MDGQKAASSKKKERLYVFTLIIMGIAILLFGLFSHAYLLCLILTFLISPCYLIALIVFLFQKKYNSLAKILLVLQSLIVLFLAFNRPPIPYVDYAKFHLLKSDYEEAARTVASDLQQAENALLEKYSANKYKRLARYGYDLEYIKIEDDIAVFFPQISNFFVYAGYLYYPKEASFIDVKERTIVLDETHRLIYDSLIPINEQWYYFYIY